MNQMFSCSKENTDKFVSSGRVAYWDKVKIEANVLGKRSWFTNNMGGITVFGPNFHTHRPPWLHRFLHLQSRSTKTSKNSTPNWLMWITSQRQIVGQALGNQADYPDLPLLSTEVIWTNNCTHQSHFDLKHMIICSNQEYMEINYSNQKIKSMMDNNNTYKQQ